MDLVLPPSLKIIPLLCSQSLPIPLSWGVDDSISLPHVNHPLSLSSFNSPSLLAVSLPPVFLFLVKYIHGLSVSVCLLLHLSFLL